ncbi:MAG TPA: hypothetical protein VGL65_07450 [Gemmatimonadales bacterium]|jgi:hypothetical protein
MAIDPVVPAAVPQPDPQRAQGTSAGPRVGRGRHGHHATADTAATDQVDLSPDAAAISGAAIPAGELSPDALRTIAQKVASGAYSDPAVADRIAGRLLDSGEISG